MEVWNSFKGLDLIECLKNCGWRFMTLYRRQWSRPSPRKRNAKRQNGCLTRWVKKGSKRQRRKGNIYPFECRVPKNSKERLKKAFLNDQCKEIEENNRIGKTRDLFKKMRNTKGTFHAKMGTIKDRNGMELQKQKILRRGGKNTQNYTEKIFMTQIITMVWSLT